MRRLISMMPAVEQIKLAMEIIDREQRRRIMLGVFDSATGEVEKAALLLDALHTEAEQLEKVLQVDINHHVKEHTLLWLWPSALRPEHQRLLDEVEALKVRSSDMHCSTRLAGNGISGHFFYFACNIWYVRRKN